MLRRGRLAAFESVEELHKALRAIRQVEDWTAEELPGLLSQSFNPGWGPALVEVTDVEDGYRVWPADLIYRSTQNKWDDHPWWDLTITDSNPNPPPPPSPPLPTPTWDGKKATAIPLNEDLVLEKGAKYLGFMIGYWEIFGYAHTGFPVILVVDEQKFHFKVAGYNAGLYSGSRVKADGTTHPFPISLVYRIQRFPSNATQPNLQNNQVIECKTDPDRPTYWYKVDASGSMFTINVYSRTDCTTTPPTTYLKPISGRDLYEGVEFSISPPPPTNSYWCVSGLCGLYASPPLGSGVTGPYDTLALCQAACTVSPPPPPPPTTNKYWCVPSDRGGSTCQFFATAPAAYTSGPYDTVYECTAVCGITVPPPPPSPTTFVLSPATWTKSLTAGGAVGTQAVTASGGTPSYAWTGITNSNGSVVSVSGVIAGNVLTLTITPITAGSATITVYGEDNGSPVQTATSVGTITVT